MPSSKTITRLRCCSRKLSCHASHFCCKDTCVYTVSSPRLGRCRPQPSSQRPSLSLASCLGLHAAGGGGGGGGGGGARLVLLTWDFRRPANPTRGGAIGHGNFLG